ncbi:MAG: hypothetical protein N2558_03875 [Patescibacteria group bacterium]|nr:hypothetical protein [Patescibacteria group bacterium]
MAIRTKRILDKVNVNGTLDIVTKFDIAIENITNEIFSDIDPVFGKESFKDDFFNGKVIMYCHRSN